MNFYMVKQTMSSSWKMEQLKLDIATSGGFKAILQRQSKQWVQHCIRGEECSLVAYEVLSIVRKIVEHAVPGSLYLAHCTGS